MKEQYTRPNSSVSSSKTPRITAETAAPLRVPSTDGTNCHRAREKESSIPSPPPVMFGTFHAGMWCRKAYAIPIKKMTATVTRSHFRGLTRKALMTDIFIINPPEAESWPPTASSADGRRSRRVRPC